MNRFGRIAAGAALAIGMGGALGAAEKTKDEAAIATVDGAPVTPAELDEALGGRLVQLRTQEYELRRQVLEGLINTRLMDKEAKARGLSVADLTKQEIDDKAAPVSPDEVKTTYERLKAQGQVPATMAEADAKTRLETQMKQRHVEERRAAFSRELWSKAAVKVNLEPPRLPVSTELGAMRGPKDAPVTIVEFSDFQCPYCSRVTPTLKQVYERYGDKIRVLYREYPLPMHPQAPKAAEAGECANEQGKFWEMHDRMFADQAKLQPDDLKASAAAIGLDAAKFNECLDSGRNGAIVKRDMAEGERFGVNGTPAFFINGRPLTGAMPFDNFVKVIDEELTRAGVAVPPPAPVAVAAPVAPAAAPQAPKPATPPAVKQ